jgi:RNA polymerase sigma-70 factor, ECF subfamily
MTQMPLSDANIDLDLLRGLRTGGASAAEALSALYRRHQGPLFRYASLRLGTRDSAADLVQDVFIALMEGKLAFDATRGSLASFLFGVARNFALKRDEAARRFVSTNSESTSDADGDAGDSMDRAEQIIDPSPLPIEKLIDDHRAEAVRVALAQLAPHYRDVIILYEMHDLSYVDIAHICNIDIGTVRSRLSRARDKLTQLLGHLNTDKHMQDKNKTETAVEMKVKAGS